MTSISEALTSISLEKYTEAFLSLGFTSLEELMHQNPNDLDKTLTEAGMLKGHTFKLKKLIDDAKAGTFPKPVQTAPKPSIAKPVVVEASSRPNPEIAKSVESNSKELIDKVGSIKSQCTSIIQTRDSLVSSLKQFLDIDLAPYSEALAQLKTMQDTIRTLLHSDIEMVN